MKTRTINDFNMVGTSLRPYGNIGGKKSFQANVAGNTLKRPVGRMEQLVNMMKSKYDNFKAWLREYLIRVHIKHPNGVEAFFRYTRKMNDLSASKGTVDYNAMVKINESVNLNKPKPQDKKQEQMRNYVKQELAKKEPNRTSNPFEDYLNKFNTMKDTAKSNPVPKFEKIKTKNGTEGYSYTGDKIKEVLKKYKESK